MVNMNQLKSKFKKRDAVNLIALVITVIVLLILLSVAINLTLKNGGILQGAKDSKYETRKVEYLDKLKHELMGMIIKMEREGKSKGEINTALNNYLQKKEKELKSHDLTKEEVVNEVWKQVSKENDNGNSTGQTENSSTAESKPKPKPEPERERAPMILKMDLSLRSPDAKILPVSRLPENCYIDWGDGVKSRSLMPTTRGIQEVKIYGNFDGVYLGVWEKDWMSQGRMQSLKLNYIKGDYYDPNANNQFSSSESEWFFKSIIEIKDWGENNFAGIVSTSFDSSNLISYATPRPKSFENLKVAVGWFYSSKVSNIDPNLFTNAPKLEIASGIFLNCSYLTGSVPANLFANNKELRSISLCFYFCQGLRGNAPEFWNDLPYINVNEGYRYQAIYFGCTKLSNYGNLPNAAKRAN